MLVYEGGKSIREPAGMEPDLRSNLRKSPAGRVNAGFEMVPSVGQPLAGIETVHLPVGVLRDEVDRGPESDAAFQHQAVHLGVSQCELERFESATMKSGRGGAPAFDVVPTVYKMARLLGVIGEARKVVGLGLGLALLFANYA